MASSVAPRTLSPALRWSLLSLLAAAPASAVEVILRTGDAAPGLGGLTVAGFSEAPSTNDEGHVLLHVTLAGGGVTAANDGVIYRWHRSEGFVKVVREGETVDFNGGTRTLDILGTPIVDNRGWVGFTSTLVSGGSGMVLWEPPSTLHPVAVVGETLSVDCQTTTGAPCGTPTVSGTLLNMATFGDRQAAILWSYEDSGIQYHEILFRGAIDNNTFGDPDSLWRWLGTESGGSTTTVDSVASELELADQTENANFFVTFTDLAACDQRFGLFDIQDLATDTVYQIDEFGSSHTLLDRYYPVDTVNRQDMHCFGGSYSYAGSRGTIANDHDQTKRGVFIDTTQIYQATVTSAELGGGHTIGPPFGQAITRDDPPKSVFSANMIGTTYNGKGGVWRRGTTGGTDMLLYESQPLAVPPADVQTIYSAHAGGTGAVAFHVLMSNANQALIGKAQDSIFGDVFKILTRGDTVPNGSGGTLTVDFFSVLGGLPADPVVLGGGGDGQLSALNARGEFVFLVFFQSAAGSGLYKQTIDPRLFFDDFESTDYCAWSAVAGASACV